MNNPLLSNYELPPFSSIQAEHVESAINQRLTQNRTRLEELLTSTTTYTWDNLITSLEDMQDRLNKTWSPVYHLNAVMNSESLRAAYNACLPKISEYATELSHNERLYNAYRSIAEGEEYQKLETVQRKVIDNALRDFRLAGIALLPEQKHRFKVIMQTLSQLQSKFQDNVLDATQAWKKHISDESDLSGLPDSAKNLAQHTAAQQNLDGWLLTLDFPCYIAVMNYADNRQLRHEIYEAYSTRASDQGPYANCWDNTRIMEEILALRHEAAQLLGFTNYAEYSLATKMAKTTQEVTDFLNGLAARSLDQAKQELTEIENFAREIAEVSDLQIWDIGYFAEKLRQHRYRISQEELRAYFSENKVISGLFAVAERLYGIRISPVDDIETWHPDVRCYEISNTESELLGRFFLDLYARSNKRGGAWMDGCVTRRHTTRGLQIPAAYLVCNFAPPTGDTPALFTHSEVETLFHEFGHGLHHLLTKIDYADIAGIHGVEWDAVELPSQFMENWCWEREALDLITAHYEIGEPLPEQLYQRMLAAKHYQSAMMMVRQLEFALFDFRLHLEYEPEKTNHIEQILEQVRHQVAVLMPPTYNRFANGFTHIFAGGYAAGYYSYKWAEVLSADAFSKFEEKGIFDQATGALFLRNVLEMGGSRDAMTNFVKFRGREPNIDALLRHSGIAT